MNKNLYRSQFAQMETTEKQALMESLAVRYTMTFLGLHTFDRWGQSCTTGIFEKDGREFVFVPGDTVMLGWEKFAVGLIRRAGRNWSVCSGNGKWSRSRQNSLERAWLPSGKWPSVPCWEAGPISRFPALFAPL